MDENNLIFLRTMVRYEIKRKLTRILFIFSHLQEKLEGAGASSANSQQHSHVSSSWLPGDVFCVFSLLPRVVF
eukprot:749499-Hanusia_phi.AAC.3